MKRNSMKKWLSLLVCVVLTAAMALCMMGCDKNQEESPTEPTVFVDGQSLGEGALTFTLEVVDLQGNKSTAQIATDETTVGAALLALGVIKGDVEQYGLYIKTVNGITYDYNKDGAYWALYINGEYALAGVDQTDIVAGTTYTLQATKG